MPYADPKQDHVIAQVDELAAGSAGSTTLVRHVLHASPLHRLALILLPPGEETEPHIHPRAEEAFFVLEGAATISIGDDTVPAGPLTLVVGPAGVGHAIAASVDGVTLLASVSPNEDRPDDVVPVPGAAARLPKDR
jgi:mannose-6-phosphate isomerase-like protein (cupin superfamily)